MTQRPLILPIAVFCTITGLCMLAIMALPAQWLTLSPIQGRLPGLHLLLEILALMIGSLIVASSWHTFERRDNRHTHLLIVGFLVVLACDLQHALTYASQPVGAQDDETPLALYFWLMGRTAELLTLGAIALRAAPHLTLRTSLLSGIGLVAAVTAGGELLVSPLPIALMPRLVPIHAIANVLLVVTFWLVAVGLWRRAWAAYSYTLATLGTAAFLLGFGSLAYTPLFSPSDVQNLAGHVYKLMAYVMLYRATFAVAIRRPLRDLQASEQRERESQARMALISANLPHSVLFQVMHAPDGQRVLTEVSDSVERVLGLRADEVRGNLAMVYRHFHPDDEPLVHEAHAMSAETMTVFDREVRFVRPDGQVRWLHFVSVPRRLDDGRLAWEGMATDTTDRREADEARRRLEHELFEAHKMESIGTLASGIAHDFNNAVAAILGNTAMALEDLERNAHEEVRRGLEQVRRSAMRARNLVSQILSFSRKQPLQRSAQHLRPIVEECLSLLHATLPANIELTLRCDAPDACAEVDRTQFEQVLLNLCTNASHAIGERNGQIEVTLTELNSPEGKRLVRITVTDNGQGMSKATVQRIFEPFFTTKPVGQGTGLGLSVVQRIVREHEGQIAVTSAPGQGTRFDIDLPLFPIRELLAGTTESSAKACENKANTAPERGQWVLCVDDETVVADMTGKLLQRAGFRVSCVSDPREAIERLRDEGDSISALVTDYRMPGISGLELIRIARRWRPHLPTVLLSGYVDDELRETAQADGASQVLEKQAILDELVHSLDSLLAEPHATAA